MNREIKRRKFRSGHPKNERGRRRSRGRSGHDAKQIPDAKRIPHSPATSLPLSQSFESTAMCAAIGSLDISRRFEPGKAGRLTY